MPDGQVGVPLEQAMARIKSMKSYEMGCCRAYHPGIHARGMLPA
jgi:hypothetical protein